MIVYKPHPIRHVVVEGCDATGKDGLLDALIKYRAPGIGSTPHFTMHPRASTSLGGPVSNLDSWVMDDLASMPTQTPSLYNRHPLISELIYAKYRKVTPGLRGKFRQPPWVKLNQHIMAQHCVVVFCAPPWEVVKHNLMVSGADAHMPGVFDNAQVLYLDYLRMAGEWPGPKMWYNYTFTPKNYFMQQLTPVLFPKKRGVK